jgi:hypothetical protein
MKLKFFDTRNLANALRAFLFISGPPSEIHLPKKFSNGMAKAEEPFKMEYSPNNNILDGNILGIS